MDATMGECVNLRERFGRRCRVGFDPAYSARHVPREKLDPWYMVIPCWRGEIWPHGGTTLAVDLKGRRAVTVRRLLATGVCRLYRDGNDGSTLLFEVADFGRWRRSPGRAAVGCSRRISGRRCWTDSAGIDFSPAIQSGFRGPNERPMRNTTSGTSKPCFRGWNRFGVRTASPVSNATGSWLEFSLDDVSGDLYGAKDMTT